MVLGPCRKRLSYAVVIRSFALLHSLMVTEKQGAFSYWTILFSLLAFAFSVLGTFIVRSGALTSVHAFALDSSRGYVLLLIFFLLTVGSLSLLPYAQIPMKVRSNFH